MKMKRISCILACLMIFLTGCSGNTAKEVAQNKTETSFPAGNTEMHSQEEARTEKQSPPVEEKAPISAEKDNQPVQNQTDKTDVKKPTEETGAEKPKTEQKQEEPKQTPDNPKQQEQPKEQPTSVPKPTENPAEPKPTETPKQEVDINTYISFAKEYAESIGLSLDSTATECWDNPITVNPNRTDVKGDIKGRLNRYKNTEGFTAVWIWAEKVSDTEYEMYIGYC